MKICTRCGLEKDLTEFNKNKKHKDWYSYSCKDCIKEYFRTKHWLITKIYSTQMAKSRKRWHKAPMYTHLELEQWILKQSNFEELYKNWEESNYKKDLVPSCDRKDNYKSYTFDNIQLMTWEENRNNLYEHMRSWKLIHWNKPQRAVMGTNIKTWETFKFVSINDALRKIWFRMYFLSLHSD